MDEDGRRLNEELHDASLLSIEVDWPAKTATLELRARENFVTVEVLGITSLMAPRDEPWGPSEQVNGLVWVRSDRPPTSVLEFEMQSGDIVRVAGASVSVARSPR